MPTQLTPEQEQGYQSWKAALPDRLQYDGNYDLRGAYLSNATEAANGHLPDTYKLQNHPTFSDESQYNSKETPGGHWAQLAAPDAANPEGLWAFKATDFNLKQNPNLPDYFRQVEPTSTLVMPDGRVIAPAQGTPLPPKAVSRALR
jgi:hypothetical protein